MTRTGVDGVLLTHYFIYLIDSLLEIKALYVKSNKKLFVNGNVCYNFKLTVLLSTICSFIIK